MKKGLKNLHYAIDIILLLVVGFIDYKMGFRISSMLFYLVPIFLASWYVGERFGIVMAISSAIMWFFVDKAAGHTYLHFWTPYWNAFARLFVFLYPVLLVKLRKMLDSEKELARKDALTGLSNRRAFLEICNIENDRFIRHKHPYSLVMLDCDNFKSVNDTHGHKEGDLLLCRLGQALSDNLRTSDYAARMGGDEFMLLLVETDYEQARAFLKRLLPALLEEMAERQWPVTFSVGALTVNSPIASIKSMIEKVDKIMYSAKNNGKNTIVHRVYSDVPANTEILGVSKFREEAPEVPR